MERGVAPAQYELFQGLTAAELEKIVPLLTRHHYRRQETIIHVGDEANHLCLLAQGQVSVMLPQENVGKRRLATFSAGMAFGEMALLDRAPRSAMIVADTEVQCDLLSLEALQRLDQQDPGIKIKLLENLALGLCGKLRKANRELAVLD
jgi:glutaminase